MSMNIKSHGETYVKPSNPGPSEEVELSGVDVLFNRMNLRFAYFFPDMLPASALKASLAEVLNKFPILAGRQKKKGKRHWIDCSGQGVLVREQRAKVHRQPGAIDDAFLRNHVEKFVGGNMNATINNEKEGNLILTFTEIDYIGGWTGLFACAPGFSCYPESTEEEARPAGSDTASTGAVGDPPHKYAVGICISHDIADGGSVAQFMLAWALASMGQPFPPTVHDRGVLRMIAPGSPALEQPSTLTILSVFGQMHLASRMITGHLRHDFVKLRFTGKELENLKAKAMAPLANAGPDIWVSTSNALAAHLWPILSAFMAPPGREGRLVPISVIVNYRKQFGLGPMYFGNAVGIRSLRAKPGTGQLMGHQLPELTRLALMIRQTCVVTPEVKESFMKEAQYLQHVQEKGTISNHIFSQMYESLAGGAPMMLWDDVSGFQPPKNMGFGLCGVTGTGAAAFALTPFPGIALVMPTAPGPDGLPGKEIIVCLSKRGCKTIQKPEWQARIHRYARSSTSTLTADDDSATAATAPPVVGTMEEETKDGVVKPAMEGRSGASVEQ